MKSLTLHKLPAPLAERLEREARGRGKSLNKTAQELLQFALGMDGEKPKDPMDDYRDLFGKWTQEQYDEFMRNIADMRQIDPEDWE